MSKNLDKDNVQQSMATAMDMSPNVSPTGFWQPSTTTANIDATLELPSPMPSIVQSPSMISLATSPACMPPKIPLKSKVRQGSEVTAQTLLPTEGFLKNGNFTSHLDYLPMPPRVVRVTSPVKRVLTIEEKQALRVEETRREDAGWPAFEWPALDKLDKHKVQGKTLEDRLIDDLFADSDSEPEPEVPEPAPKRARYGTFPHGILKAESKLSPISSDKAVNGEISDNEMW
tara:strand:- start:834 stop:1523 length:690 start_codon:yes stop_codon:yes gene_type:complete